MSEPSVSLPLLVLDTNIVLDIWLYQDAATPALRQALENQQLCWIATQPMREELRRVLDYAHIAARRQQAQVSVEQFMACFDRHANIKNTAQRAPYVCKDEDDQKFIDLAVTHQATLLSKDKQVLKMTRRLAKLGVQVRTAWI
jgi:putative PIN family toxin of toxin-antitoxin system